MSYLKGTYQSPFGRLPNWLMFFKKQCYKNTHNTTTANSINTEPLVFLIFFSNPIKFNNNTKRMDSNVPKPLFQDNVQANEGLRILLKIWDKSKKKISKDQNFRSSLLEGRSRLPHTREIFSLVAFFLPFCF